MPDLPLTIKGKKVHLYCYRQKTSLQVQHHLQEFQLDLLYHMQNMTTTICGPNQKHHKTEVLWALFNVKHNKQTDAISLHFARLGRMPTLRGEYLCLYMFYVELDIDNNGLQNITSQGAIASTATYNFISPSYLVFTTIYFLTKKIPETVPRG